MKNVLYEEKLKEALDDEDKKIIETISAEGLQWMEENPDADGDAIEGERKELEAKFSSLFKVNKKTGGAGMSEAGGKPSDGMPGEDTGVTGPADAVFDDLD